MSQPSIQGSVRLAEAIRCRRQELGLTIQEAAAKANVGIKTWCRYEAGESIRRDKVKGICKTLNWSVLPGDTEDKDAFDLEEFKSHEAWSQFICDNFGEAAAISFVLGSDSMIDSLNEDLNELSRMPRGTHIGQLPVSMMKDLLPEQFLMRYDYEFLYSLKAAIQRLQAVASGGKQFSAHSVMEELALYLCTEEADFSMDILRPQLESAGIDGLDDWQEWIYDLFDDDDIDMLLYSGADLPPDNKYHFDHWADNQFYFKRDESGISRFKIK